MEGVNPAQSNESKTFDQHNLIAKPHGPKYLSSGVIEIGQSGSSRTERLEAVETRKLPLMFGVRERC